MKRRKSRGFGSSAKVHSRQQALAAHSAIAESDGVVRAATDGHCNIAYQHLKVATLEYGKVIAHGVGGSVDRTATERVHLAMGVFGRECVRR